MTALCGQNMAQGRRYAASTDFFVVDFVHDSKFINIIIIRAVVVVVVAVVTSLSLSLPVSRRFLRPLVVPPSRPSSSSSSSSRRRAVVVVVVTSRLVCCGVVAHCGHCSHRDVRFVVVFVVVVAVVVFSASVPSTYRILDLNLTQVSVLRKTWRKLRHPQIYIFVYWRRRKAEA